jgi:hypothetical protein
MEYLPDYTVGYEFDYILQPGARPLPTVTQGNFYIFQLWKAGHTVVDSIVMGADRRFRALMMTALVDGLGLLPAALSTRIGAQTQRPLAIVIIGRAISIALLTRVFQPTLVYLLRRPLGLIDEGRATVATNCA